MGWGVSEGFPEEAAPQTKPGEELTRRRGKLCAGPGSSKQQSWRRGGCGVAPEEAGRWVEAGWSRIFLWHLSPTLKPRGSPGKSEGRTVGSYLCEDATLGARRGLHMRGTD